MINLLSPYKEIVIIAVIFAAGCGAGWGVNGWRLNSKLSEEQAAHSRDLTSVAVAAKNQYSEELRKYKSEVAISAAIGVDFKEATRNAKISNDALLDRVNSGNERLYVPTKCAPSTSGMPTPGNTGQPVNGARAELDPTSRQDYYTFRESLERLQNKLIGLQDHIRRVCVAPALEDSVRGDGH